MVDTACKVTISVIIITLNEEKDIERCLSSVSWADEIVVVDSGSDDRTIDIARRYTDRVFEREFTDFSDQRQFAASNCRNDWVLSIDTDEVVSIELRGEIEGVVSDSFYDAYCLPETTHIFGGWLKHGHGNPDYHIRLYRRSKGSWQRVVHERIVTSGKIGFLNNPILHYAYTDVSSFLSSMNRYTTLEVKFTEERPEHLTLKLCLSPLRTFARIYLLHGGYLDGARGLIVSTLVTTHEFLRWAKLWVKFNLDRAESTPPSFQLTLRTRLIRWRIRRGWSW